MKLTTLILFISSASLAQGTRFKQALKADSTLKVPTTKVIELSLGEIAAIRDNQQIQKFAQKNDSILNHWLNRAVQANLHPGDTIVSSRLIGNKIEVILKPKKK